MVPLTIVTGFLGAGKTTLVNHILSSAPQRRIGVLVNDFGEVNIDSRLILGVAGDVVSLSNGCICCSMRGDLVAAVMRVIEHAQPPEHILVEASGVSNPGPLADIFLGLQKSGVLRVDGIVAVVDAEHFPFDDLKGQALARDQVLASDLIVLNKVDLVDAERLEAIEESVRARIADARILRVTRGQVPVDVALGLEGSAHAHAHAHEDEHEHVDHGFDSFVYRSEAPLVFKRLVEALKAMPPGIVRVKGILALVERPGDRVALHMVGKRVQVETLGTFEGTAPRSEIVIIGERAAMDEGALAAELDRCRQPGADST